MFNFDSVKEMDVMAPSKRKEGCRFTGVVRDEKDGSVTFNFVDSTGATLGHREFVPKQLDQMSDEDFKKSTSLSISRIAHIYRAFSTQEEFNNIRVENDSDDKRYYEQNWKSITKQVGLSLKAKIAAGQDMTCDLKVVLVKNKDKWYSALPKVPAFISTVNVPKEFKIDPKYDIFEIPASAPAAGGIPPAQGGAPAAGATNAFAGAAPSGDPDF